MRVHYAGVATVERRGDEQVDRGVGVRGVNRKRATCGKWKWTKYRCKHSTVRVSIYDAPSSISPALSRSPDPPFATSKGTHARAHTKGHDSTVRLSFIPAAPSPRAPPSFPPCAVSTTDVRLPVQNSPVTRIHQVSAKYRNPLLSPFFFVSPRLRSIRA